MYPNQGYNYPTDPYYDPNQQYWGNQDYYDPYTNQYYDSGYDEPQEDTESAVLRREQEEQERIEALESNRLYLKKLRKQCVLEDFSALENKQLFLFEILIESLEVNSEPVLGLVVPEENKQDYIIVQAKFLNSPYLEIRHKDEPSGAHHSTEYSEYLQTVGDSWQSNPKETHPPVTTTTPNDPELQSLSSGEGTLDSDSKKLAFDTKWKDGNGKSCLFSMAAMEMIQNLDKYPVKIQVDHCIGLTDDECPESREPLGYTSIRLPDEFALSVLQSLKPEVVLPVTSVHRQTCDVRSVFGVKKGKLDVFIRLSAFGPVIITSVHMVEGERYYSFHPSPMATMVEKREFEVNRSDVLKPLISEEDNTLKHTISRDSDFFQKPVMWKSDVQHCGCLESSFSKRSILQSSKFDSMSLTKLPFSSDINLCRNVTPGKEYGTLRQFGKDLCDWHNLVSLEIKNSPDWCCECLIEGGDNYCKNDLLKKLSNARRPYQPLPPITGVGLKPEPIDCGCDCPEIREALRHLYLNSQ